MAIDFPSSPTNGQTFTLGAVVYTYNSTLGVWKPATLGTALPFNLLINPAMQISQQNGVTASAVNATGFYPADQWNSVESKQAGSDFNATYQRVAKVTPRGSPYRSRIIYTGSGPTTIQAGDYVGLAQNIEGNRIAALQWGTASAKPVVLRFGMNASAGASMGGASISYSLRNMASTFSYVGNFNFASSGNADAEYVFAIPGCTTGVWPTDTSGAMQLWITIIVGGTYRAATLNQWISGNFVGGAVGTSIPTQNFEIYDVGLYADPLGTGRAPAWEYPSDRQATFDCLRHWQKDFGALGIGIASTGTPGRASYPNQAQMRIAPSMAGGFVGSMNFWDQATSPALTNIAAAYVNKYYFEADYTCASAQTAGRASMLINTSQSVYIAHNARM